MGSYSIKIFGDPPSPALCKFLAGEGGYFEKLSYGSETLDMTSEGLEEMFEGDYADMCGKQILLMWMGG